MSAYGDLDTAIAGMIADNNSVTRVESRACQESNGIQFGQTCWGYRSEPDVVYGFYLDVTKIALDADFGGTDAVNFTVNGVTTGNVVYATSHDNTMDLCIAAITALTGVEAALDAADANNRTIYVRTKGATNTTTMADVADAPPAETLTQETDQVFLGVAVFVQKDLSAANTAKYDQYQDVSIMSIGVIWGFLNGVCSSEAKAYGLNSSTGKFTTTAGNTIGCTFRSDNYTNATTSDVIAKVEVNGPLSINTERVWV